MTSRVILSLCDLTGNWPAVPPPTEADLALDLAWYYWHAPEDVQAVATRRALHAEATLAQAHKPLLSEPDLVPAAAPGRTATMPPDPIPPVVPPPDLADLSYDLAVMYETCRRRTGADALRARTALRRAAAAETERDRLLLLLDSLRPQHPQ
jgi:hypothetical protein